MKLWSIFGAIFIGIASSIIATALQHDPITSIIIGLLIMLLAFIIYQAYIKLTSFYPKLLGGDDHAYAASAIVFNEKEEILLIFNPNQNRWLPPSTHVHKGEFPHEEAKKSIFSEAGYSIDFHESHDIEKHIDRFSTQIPQPFAAQIEHQEAGEGHSIHYDFFYLFCISSLIESQGGKHHHKWVTMTTLIHMANCGETYPDVVKVIEKAKEFKKYKKYNSKKILF